MNRYLYLGVYFIAAVVLLAIGIFGTANVFKTDGNYAGMTSASAWLVALVMLWFLGPQRQADGSFI